MDEYITLGHMSPVIEQDVQSFQHFLPHHCVLKESSSTTKLRVVFDGSANTTTGYSLNDILMAGPTIQPTLFDILIRFRSFSVALTADICKMYRCIRMTAPDNLLQCILWRKDSKDPLQTYKLDTVTYGTRPVAFLAIRSMHQLAKDEAAAFPIGSIIMHRDFYVDDLITGGNSNEEVAEIMRQTASLLKRGHFFLRKWRSNDSTILSSLPNDNSENLVTFDDGSNIEKTLGLVWNPIDDNFLFSFTPQVTSKRFTKRSILSTLARFYDPLGLIGPVIAKIKIFLQRLWIKKLDWDESLPNELHTSWTSICGEMSVIQGCTFPRFVSIPEARLEVHAFCDASLAAYGACVYVRAQSTEKIRTSILCSKSRVAPLKSLTVPKLELCAAALLAKLVHAIKKANVFTARIFCWTDSSIALSWIKEEPTVFNIFVSNRVSKIQELTMGMEWRYVPSELNPADILSRGATPNELLNSRLWAHGPEFLQGDPSNWPTNNFLQTNLPERRTKVLITASQVVDISIGSRFINDFGKMQRIFTYIKMFMSKDKSGHLTPSKIKAGTLLLMRMIQRIHLSHDYKLLEKTQRVSSSSNLVSLMPFLDEVGVIRVGGRLKNSFLGFDARHPIILPKHHPLTVAMINHYHRKNLHAGAQALLSTIRLQYWPIGGRKSVAHVINKCIICFRAKPQVASHVMGNLPKDRLQTFKAFSITGIDFCGPFYYKSDIRNKPSIKSYIAIFVCFSTKAVHLELVRDLSTPGFLAALHRFICTRGKPCTIWSDNATNFVGAKNELAELRDLFQGSDHQAAVKQKCIAEHINWNFIPPASPHFGGLWEAAVKTAKFHFYRVARLSHLNFDELRTLVCHISAIMNSRPLLPISERPDDLDVLTPAHFLIGDTFTAITEPDVTQLNINRLSQWQRVSFMQQTFWKRWSVEYMTQLQERSKWKSHSSSIRIGHLVLIKDENLPPLRWPLGRIVDIIAGNDGVIRVAVIRTQYGMTKRAVAKLCPLPINDDIESMPLPTGGRCRDSANETSPQP